MKAFTVLLHALAVGFFLAAPAGAADRATLRTFLEVTGFDVAITSMQQAAMDSPGIVGTSADDFGSEYTRLAEQAFDPEAMLSRALDMMEAVMPDELVNHGAAFYASDLGLRLVAAENESHRTDDDTKYTAGDAILARLDASNPRRIEDYLAMNTAIGGTDASLRAIVEVQVRYVMAAMAAGSLDLAVSEGELREMIAAQLPMMREEALTYALLGSAYTYRDFTDEEIAAYRAALEAPEMRQVYEILNAVQFEIMAERYEALALELGKLTPQQDI